MTKESPDKLLSKNAPYNVSHIDYSVYKDKRVTPSIEAFVRGGITMRTTILAFILYAADHLKPGMKVIDIGAGDSPYKEIFNKQDYKTTDFAGTDYHEYKNMDYVCPAHEIPVDNESFDAIICTEVMEHVPNPNETIKEFNRILKKNGQLFITTPFIISIHEIPYDFLRYTPFYYDKLLKEAGFKVKFITPRGGMFAAITSQLLEIPLTPPKGFKNILVYLFLFLPLFFLPIFVFKHIYIKLSFIIDNALDQKQIFTPGYAVHAVKEKDIQRMPNESI